VGGHEFSVEVVMTPEDRAQGLMHRVSLGENEGMLFIFPRPEPRNFWMKNTLIPLSIAYISENGRINEILDMEPLDESGVPGSFPSMYALEVNQGRFDELGIKVGDYLNLRPILPLLPNRGRAQN
jgi:uncharacterized membrane protein (UPF0127 family)